MADKFRNKYRIDSNRLQNWNYGWNGSYFITICTKNRINYFGEVLNGKMKLSHIGVIADVFWFEIQNHAKSLTLGEFVVMPNHVHGILNDKIDSTGAGEVIDPRAEKKITPNPPELAPSSKKQPSAEKSPTSENPSTSENEFDPAAKPIKTIGHNRFQNQGKNTISSIVGSYKSAVTKHCNRLGLEFSWQPSFYDHII
ncbi:transposase, partial [Cryomorpha ignava]|uniref:transposase n=1 Tax=Cryomorpha ignava TaxID=101383 RepID=UPI001953434F